MDEDNQAAPGRSRLTKVSLGLSAAAAFGLGVYALLEAVRPSSGLVSFSFLLITPAAICAFVAYFADLEGDAPAGRYWSIPLWTLLAIAVIGTVVLREGVICIVLLSPLWVISGLMGAALTYHLRKRIRDGRKYCSALLVLPLVAIQIEPNISLPEQRYTVTRSEVIAASPERIWPLLRGVPDVRPDEGRWNLSQDVIGVPRPLGARLVGEGIGAARLARWGRQIAFREEITQWQPNRAIAWRFVFDGSDGWHFTDRHLVPDGPYFRVEHGGYWLTPIDPHHTRLTISTTYWIRTPVNGYSAAWGEVFLGDLENNLLAIVRGRAEG
jgi:hypothetical protein